MFDQQNFAPCLKCDPGYAYLERELNKVQKALAETEAKNCIDSITGLRNKAYFDDEGIKMLANHIRIGMQCSLVLINIDSFKSINDSHGYSVGDILIAQFSNLLKHMIRIGDTLCRVDGDEFVLMLPFTEAAEGLLLADNIQKTIQEKEFFCSENCKFVNVKATLAVATFVPPLEDEKAAESVEEFFQRAHRELRVAKAQGKNQVVLAQDAA